MKDTLSKLNFLKSHSYILTVTPHHAGEAPRSYFRIGYSHSKFPEIDPFQSASHNKFSQILR